VDTKRFLNERNVSYTVLPHFWSQSAAQRAKAVHALPQQVAKTVMLHANHSYYNLGAIAPADARIALKKVGRKIGGTEIRLATEQDVAAPCRDCEPGVLPPFGSEYEMLTLVDKSLSDQEHIVIGRNARSEALQLQW
jgi:Ala-tRNA(Pro) deacylase